MFNKKKIKEILLITFMLLFFSIVKADETFLSLKKNKVNVRYGPGFDFPIKFIYKKINLPIKQIDSKENWRRIIDLKNNSGWIHRSQLKKINSIIPLNDKILFQKPSIFSKPIALIERGRVLMLKNCSINWCKISSEKFKGWIQASNNWGSIKK
tara:strand:+ start:10462 stop:10923 length:462 start_codon:yes stop_codon:yes gene_type:complete